MIHSHVITGAVTHQQIAVFIQDISPGGFYPGEGGKGILVIGVAFCFYDLQIIKFKDKESDRKQVTGIKREKLLMIADMLDSCLKSSKHFVVGGLRQIKDVSIDKVVKLESVMSR